MDEKLLLALLQCAETWANRARTTLAARHEWSPTTFGAGKRPEERALLSAAAEVYDLLGATPEGCVLLGELGLAPDAGALPTFDGLSARMAEHRARCAGSGSGAVMAISKRA